MIVDVSVSEHESLVARAAELQQFGFDIESFGGSSVKVTAVPALLDATDCTAALLALAHDLDGLDRGAKVQDALQRIAATTACHAAVKANYPLSYEKMTHILAELRATAYSTVCPHGRPVMLRLTRREIEKNFERI
jgi:DNA mismatch repair protein MutL